MQSNLEAFSGETQSRNGPPLGKISWAVIWGVAISATLVGGSWSLQTETPPNWKFDIQFPGGYAVLLFGWFIGPTEY